MIKFGINTRFRLKERGQLTEERIVVLDVWDDHGRRVTCKGLDMLEDDFCMAEISSYVVS